MNREWLDLRLAWYDLSASSSGAGGLRHRGVEPRLHILPHPGTDELHAERWPLRCRRLGKWDQLDATRLLNCNRTE